MQEFLLKFGDWQGKCLKYLLGTVPLRDIIKYDPSGTVPTINMNPYAILPIISFLFLLISGFYLLRKRAYYRFLGICCFVLCLVEFSNFMVFVGPNAVRALFWQYWALAGVLLLPLCWSILSLTFGRENFRAIIKKRSWYLLAIFFLTIWFLSYLKNGSIISEVQVAANAYGFVLGTIGRYSFIFLLLSFVVVLLNLENTYSSSIGRQSQGIRHAIKGISIFVGAYFILSSLVLLFSYIDIRFTLFGSFTTILGLIFIIRSISKHGPVDTEVRVRRQAIYSSGALTIVGIYLIIIGLIAKMFLNMGINLTSFVSFLAAFLVFFLLASIVFSRSLKKRLRLFIDHSFYKDKYDYRREWANLSERIGTILDMDKLIIEIKSMIKQILHVESVELVLDNPDTELTQWLLRYGEPISVEQLSESNSALYEQNREYLDRLEADTLVSLNAKQKLLGMLVIGRKTGGGSFSGEDIELLKIISRQVGIAILNARLSRELIVSQELEDFHKISTFLIHDLKNCVSMLSMITQNAADNLDNPEFQKDSLVTISNTITKMNNLMQKLSTLPKKLELNRKSQNLNVLIDEAISQSKIEDIGTVKLIRLFENLPPIKIDSEYMQKVIVNLFLNAVEAMPNGGNLMVKTSLKNGTATANSNMAQIEVSDTGVGMSAEFIQQRLFKPFQSSKRKGIGVGLFQCKAIIEAHGGNIVVESNEGKGTKFTVRLPI